MTREALRPKASSSLAFFVCSVCSINLEMIVAALLLNFLGRKAKIADVARPGRADVWFSGRGVLSAALLPEC